ncbi:flagellin, partial [Planctomycetota bacterium]
VQITAQSADIQKVKLHSINFDGFASRTMSAVITATAAQASSVTGIANNAAIVNGAGDVIFRVSGDRGTQTITLGAGSLGSAMRDAVNLVSLNTGVYASETGAGAIIFRSIDFGSDAFITVEQVAGSGALLGTTEVFNDQGLDVEATIEGMQATGKGNTLSIDSFALSVELMLSATATGCSYAVADALSFTAVKSGLNFQLNTEAVPNDAVRIGIGSVNSAFLGEAEREIFLDPTNSQTIGGVLTTLRAGGSNDLESDPGNAIRIVDAAIDDVNDVRARLGALKADVLDSNSRSLGVAIENLTSSESSIRDLDFAAETAEFTRTQILFQAGTAVLASANLIPQTILSLLQ